MSNQKRLGVSVQLAGAIARELFGGCFLNRGNQIGDESSWGHSGSHSLLSSSKIIPGKPRSLRNPMSGLRITFSPWFSFKGPQKIPSKKT